MRAALTEEKVPERVPVERKQVERAAVRNHKIRTDTGIEISFPAEMGSNSEYIEFVQRAQRPHLHRAQEYRVN